MDVGGPEPRDLRPEGQGGDRSPETSALRPRPRGGMKGSDTTDRKVPVVRPGRECSHRRSSAGQGLDQLQQVTSEAPLVGVQLSQPKESSE